MILFLYQIRFAEHCFRQIRLAVHCVFTVDCLFIKLDLLRMEMFTTRVCERVLTTSIFGGCRSVHDQIQGWICSNMNCTFAHVCQIVK